jgi:hypothetical protein
MTPPRDPFWERFAIGFILCALDITVYARRDPIRRGCPPNGTKEESGEEEEEEEATNPLAA